ALDVDVIAVEHLQLLHLSVDFALLVVDVDVDDVDRAGDRAQLAGDAAIEGEAEHAAKTIRWIEPLFRIADGDLRPEELAQSGLQPLQHVEDQKPLAPIRLRILDLHAPSSVSSSR